MTFCSSNRKFRFGHPPETRTSNDCYVNWATAGWVADFICRHAYCRINYELAKADGVLQGHPIKSYGALQLSTRELPELCYGGCIHPQTGKYPVDTGIDTKEQASEG